MMNSHNQVSPKTARQLLIDAENSGVSVEEYLKKIVFDDENSESCYKQHSVGQVTVTYDFSESRKWLKDNAQKYSGKWVVLDGEKLIGAGDEPISLVEKARKKGVKIPFVYLVNGNSEPFMGGWL